MVICPQPADITNIRLKFPLQVITISNCTSGTLSLCSRMGTQKPAHMNIDAMHGWHVCHIWPLLMSSKLSNFAIFATFDVSFPLVYEPDISWPTEQQHILKVIGNQKLIYLYSVNKNRWYVFGIMAVGSSKCFAPPVHLIAMASLHCQTIFVCYP